MARQRWRAIHRSGLCHQCCRQASGQWIGFVGSGGQGAKGPMDEAALREGGWEGVAGGEAVVPDLKAQ